MHGPAMKGRENVFKLIFDEARCKGCGLCVHACPKGVLALKKDILNDKGYHPAGAARPEDCIGCRSCALFCPDLVITILREEAEETGRG